MIKNIATAITIAAAALATVGTAAQAGDWGGRGYGQGHGYGYGPRHGYHASAPRHYPAYGYHQPRRDNSGKIATGVAIGVGALILGTVLANEARRQRHGY